MTEYQDTFLVVLGITEMVYQDIYVAFQCTNVISHVKQYWHL